MKNFSLILLETPKNLEISLDNLTLKPGELFKGIKEIPLGVHLLSASLKLGKTSRFLFSSTPSIQVFKWDNDLEEFSRLDEETESFYEASSSEFLPMMVKYDCSSLQAWQELTNFISQETLSKLQPMSHQILSSCKEYDKNPEFFESFSSRRSIFYTTIPTRYVKPGLSPSDLTRLNHDKTELLQDLLRKDFSSIEELLGEFQFAFVSFLLSENLESFEQWKNLLVLLCNCEEGLFSLPVFFQTFIPVLYNQIKNLPKDLVFDPFLSGSFITSSLKSFILIIEDSALPSILRTRGQKLKDLIRNEFGVSEFEMLADEDSPVISYSI
jgi:A1 cistron-splicing factor AAR2